MRRWQIQSAGRPEEQSCRFCKSPLPSWCSALLPAGRVQLAEEAPTAVMAVVYGDKVFKVPVRPGTLTTYKLPF